MSVNTDSADPTDAAFGDATELSSCADNAAKPHRYIPPEITDRIIHSVYLCDYYPSSQRTILNCALVCRDWLPAARLCLFTNDINILKPRQYDLFNAHVLRSESMKPWLKHIQKLYLYGLESRRRRSTPNIAMHHFIIDIAGRLPNLHHLTIYSFDWTTHPPHPCTYRAFSSLHALRELTMFTVDLPSFSALRYMLDSLPRLIILDLYRPKWPLTPTQHLVASGPLRKRPAIVDLTVYGTTDGCSAELLDWLALTGTRRSIRKCTLHYDGRAWPESYINFTSITAHLIAILSVPQCTADFLRLPISSMVNLRELSLKTDTRDQWRDLASALQQLPGRRLQRVTLESPTTRIDSDGLELLEPVLLEAKFKRLRVVQFQYQDDANDESIRDKNFMDNVLELHRKMPKLSASGVLGVWNRLTKDYALLS